MTVCPFSPANPHECWLPDVQQLGQLIQSRTKPCTIRTFKHWITLDMTKHHATFTPRALESKLKASGMSGDAVFKAVEKAKRARRALQSDRVFLRHHRNEWRSLLTPLRQELNHAIGGLRYDEDDVLRCDAFDLYVQTLEGMYYKMLALSETVHGDKKGMPSQVAAHLNEVHAETGKGFHIPNRGVHWVDWAPPKKRASVEHAFDLWTTSGIRKRHAKGKTPFLRIDKGGRFDKRRATLLAAAHKERATLTLQYEVAMQGVRKREAELAEVGATRKPAKNELHTRLAKRIDKATRAIHLLTLRTQADGALPRTWHGVLPRTDKKK